MYISQNQMTKNNVQTKKYTEQRRYPQRVRKQTSFYGINNQGFLSEVKKVCDIVPVKCIFSLPYMSIIEFYNLFFYFSTEFNIWHYHQFHYLVISSSKEKAATKGFKFRYFKFLH